MNIVHLVTLGIIGHQIFILAVEVIDQDLENKPVEKVMPDTLVQLTMSAEKVLTYWIQLLSFSGNTIVSCCRNACFTYKLN